MGELLRKWSRTWVGCAVLGVVLPLVACDEAKDALLDQVGANDERAALAVSSMQEGSLDTAILVALTQGLTIEDDTAVMLGAVEAIARDVFTPASCLQTLVAQDTLTMTLDRCDAPFGVRAVRGALALRLPQSSLGNVLFSLSGAGLEINGRTLVVNLTGSFEDGEDGRFWQLVTAGGGVSEARDPITRGGAFLAKVADDCVVMDGAWTLTVSETVYTLLFRSFQRCDNPCPTSGSVVFGEGEFELADGEIAADLGAITVTFVGSETVAWVDSERRGGVTTLTCAP